MKQLSKHQFVTLKKSDCFAAAHLRTLEKCRKHSPAARVSYISFVFSNALRVLSQCSTQLRLPCLLHISRNGLKQGEHKFHQPRGVGITISIYFRGCERKKLKANQTKDELRALLLSNGMRVFL